MYTFSYFKVPNTTCRNLDTIVRNFWWGHDQEVKKNAYGFIGTSCAKIGRKVVLVSGNSTS